MEEIKVGEYVRLARNQGVNKIIEIEDNRYILDDSIADEYGDLTCVLEKNKLKDEVLKHSPSIIDLIEDGDYLNGYLVRRKNGKLYNFDLNVMEWTPLEHIDIFDTLVTHEQFKQVEYKI